MFSLMTTGRGSLCTIEMPCTIHLVATLIWNYISQPSLLFTLMHWGEGHLAINLYQRYRPVSVLSGMWNCNNSFFWGLCNQDWRLVYSVSVCLKQRGVKNERWDEVHMLWLYSEQCSWFVTQGHFFSQWKWIESQTSSEVQFTLIYGLASEGFPLMDMVYWEHSHAGKLCCWVLFTPFTLHHFLWNDDIKYSSRFLISSKMEGIRSKSQ